MGYFEGDYIRTVDGLFFAVKGGRHSDELVVAVLRYIPEVLGERSLSGINYRRIYDLNASTRYLKDNYPEYLNLVSWIGIETQSVPVTKINKVYSPRERLIEVVSEPDSLLEQRIKRFVEALSEKSRVPVSSFGLSGSILIGLQNEDSDIDLNVYGEKEGRAVYNGLWELRQNSDWVTSYDDDSVESVLVSRWRDTGLSLDKLRPLECGKVLHGLVEGVDYFIRLLVEEDESQSKPLKNVILQGVITDASESIFTPCSYGFKPNSTLDDSMKLKSYRGKFAEQVQEGDRVQVRGTLEKVDDTYYRVILGGAGDYLVPVDFIA